MKSVLVLISSFLLAGTVHGSALLKSRTETECGYVQNPSGTASFTCYSGCSTPACGKTISGYTAAMNQLAFGAEPGLGAGDACGRCFRITGEADPYSDDKGPFNCIVVKITDLCPIQGNEKWCGQTASNPVNFFDKSVNFDLCEDSGASEKFFPLGQGALTGEYEEVSCSEWSGGSEGPSLWNGACLADENTPCWPSGVGCGNKGTAPA